MDWYYYIVMAAIAMPVFFCVQMVNNYRYALNKYDRDRSWYRPRTALIVPCKGIDTDFEKNITSFFDLDYDNYYLRFIVEDESDPAYEKLCELREHLSENSKALDVDILIAGQGQTCSQKIHNLLYCIERLRDDVEVYAFADSDICVETNWLSHLVYPLHQAKTGVASGYRWFVPKTNNFATLVLSALNGKIAQLLGNTRFNQVWGGSMAIRAELFEQLGLKSIWKKSISDDLSISRAVKKAGLKVAFVPACLTASYESISLGELFEFARRQFLITRVLTPATWLLGLVTNLALSTGLFAGTAAAIYAGTRLGIKGLQLATLIALPTSIFIYQLAGAILREKLVSKLLKNDLGHLKTAIATDLALFWLWPPVLLAFIVVSAFGNTIRWRGIKYKLKGPTETLIVD
ncbi:glycosyltransferase [Planctomycetota bacterium]